MLKEPESAFARWYSEQDQHDRWRPTGRTKGGAFTTHVKQQGSEAKQEPLCRASPPCERRFSDGPNEGTKTNLLLQHLTARPSR